MVVMYLKYGPEMVASLVLSSSPDSRGAEAPVADFAFGSGRQNGVGVMSLCDDQAIEKDKVHSSACLRMRQGKPGNNISRTQSAKV